MRFRATEQLAKHHRDDRPAPQIVEPVAQKI